MIPLPRRPDSDHYRSRDWEGPLRVGVHKLPMNSPNDVSALERLIDKGEVNPAEIVALIGKTEGNGGANDFTRGFATLSYSLALAKRLGVSPEEVAKRVAFVWSGGTEGVLSPHATLFTRSASEKAGGKRLAFGLGVTRDFAPEEVGTLTEVREVAAAVRRAQDEAGISGPKGRALRSGQRPASHAGCGRRCGSTRRQTRHARSQWLKGLRSGRDRAWCRARTRGSQRGRFE